MRSPEAKAADAAYHRERYANDPDYRAYCKRNANKQAVSIAGLTRQARAYGATKSAPSGALFTNDPGGPDYV